MYVYLMCHTSIYKPSNTRANPSLIDFIVALNFRLKLITLLAHLLSFVSLLW